MRQTLLTILLALLPMVASADDSGSCGNGVTYSYLESTHTLTISGEGEIETEYQDTPWYNYRNDIQTVIIEEGVTSIGESAFNGCSNLANITIPNSVTNIGKGTFDGTPWYDNQPDGLVYAGKVAYCYKGEMPPNTSIVLEESTKGIAYGAFYKCSNLDL